MKELLVSVIVSFCVSIICNRIMTIHIFKVVDNLIAELLEITKKSIRDAYSNKRSS